ncbi:ATP-dependent Clp protease ATP-binding subunit ClpA [Psychromicrobium silvestre]|uniref:ATP-dependent Clp protease ATP-binding subunit ClpA n=1 Tax=Psychromicrobium silvestre TaxID=1645614 RepID=A0A7Y9LRJ7_9MICC|nr:Clp protease N-terminal domain-containing protein [Psychromicrobium silvestre]NYE94292.1 ATP-dependent Clp protease ATP-binding subunit ClpA [Psychromicrobium silvestre]
MFERFARSARTAVEDARFEASRRGDRRIGTDHLLIALLRDETLAQLIGVDATAARQAADQLDRTALAAIGLAVGEFESNGGAVLNSRVPLMTVSAKTVIKLALSKAVAEKARIISSRHLMLALLDRSEPDPAASLLAALPIDPVAIRGRLAA